MNQTDILFEHFEVKTLKLKNRIAMAPMTRVSASEDGVPTPEMSTYYAKRAAGGTGLIITEGTYIDHQYSKGFFNEPGIVTAEQVEGWRNVVEAVHNEGASIAMQLFHIGRYGHPDVINGRTPRAPSAIPVDGVHGHVKKPYETPAEMTPDEIADVVQSFADSAQRSVEAGFDAIEIHGAHGYLLDEFIWDGVNQRNDGYGGSLKKQLRFPVEVVSAIREKVGNNYTIIYRLSMWKGGEYEYVYPHGLEDLDQIVSTLSQAGVDIFHVSTHEATAEFLNSGKTMARLTREISQKPVIAVGKITDSQAAVQLLSNGDADLIAIGKWQIANPNWANLVQTGREAELIDFKPEMTHELL